MAGYLNFDPNRTLEFEPGRPLEFDVGRPLEFQPNRDLGFGHRGVVFRGYICPICGALVAPDATSCNECGTVFEGPTTPPPPAPPAAPSRPSGPRPPAAPPRAPPGTEPPKAAYCAFCGVRLHKGDAFCWNCGAVVKRGSEVVKLPPRKTESVTRDWMGSKER